MRVNSFKACNVLPFFPINKGFLSLSIVKHIISSFNDGLTLHPIPNASIEFFKYY